VFSRDGRFAYVFGRDGGLTKVDLLTGTLVKRVVQSGNAIGGAISQDGRLVAVSNYEPGGVRVFDAETLEPVADIPADLRGRQPAIQGHRAGGRPRQPLRLQPVGRGGDLGRGYERPREAAHRASPGDRPPALRRPHHPDGRYYIAGLFREDGLALLDLWHPEKGVRRILPGYGRGEEPLPVYKMPHLEGWAVAGRRAFLPAVGRHEVLVVDLDTWSEVGRVPVAGQAVFVMASPTGARSGSTSPCRTTIGSR
jgi:protein NirF